VTDADGWQSDPFGLHEQRYFSLGRPTKLVRDGTVESYDEPPVPVSRGSDIEGSSAPQTSWAAEPPNTPLGRRYG
jgi:hypothetical protein